MSQEQNQKMMEWSTAWLLDGDLCRCRKCKRGIVMSRSAESFIHASGCSQAHLDSPWRDLQALFTPPPSTEPAPQDKGEFGEPWAEGTRGIIWSIGENRAILDQEPYEGMFWNDTGSYQYRSRAIACVNLLAGHDLSQVAVVPRALLQVIGGILADVSENGTGPTAILAEQAIVNLRLRGIQ